MQPTRVTISHRAAAVPGAPFNGKRLSHSQGTSLVPSTSLSRWLGGTFPQLIDSSQVHRVSSLQPGEPGINSREHCTFYHLNFKSAPNEALQNQVSLQSGPLSFHRTLIHVHHWSMDTNFHWGSQLTRKTQNSLGTRSCRFNLGTSMHLFCNGKTRQPHLNIKQGASNTAQ